MTLKKIKPEFLIFYCALCIELAFLFYQAFHYPLQGDENEHLYNAYLIFKGYVPYRDFFEHHNPLMWYILSPLYIFFENNANIYYVARFLTFIQLLGIAYFTYKISHRLNLTQPYFAPLFFLGCNIIKQQALQLRPDIPMTLCTFIGLYFFIYYLDDKKQKNLNLSLLYFFIAFMFLQKALIFIIPICIYLIIYLLKKQIQILTLLQALSIPFLLTLLYILYLYQTDSFSVYLINNYKINAFFLKNSITVNTLYKLLRAQTFKNPIIISLLLNSFLSSLFFTYKKEKTLSLFSLYTFLSFILTICTYAPSEHYYIYSIALFSVLCSILIEKINIKLLVLWFLINQQIINQTSLNNNDQPDLQSFIKINQFITNTTKADDLVFIPTPITGLKQQATGYYYFGPHEIVNITHKIFPYKEHPTNDEIILKHKPKVIYIDYEPSSEVSNLLDTSYYTIQIKFVKLYIRKNN